MKWSRRSWVRMVGAAGVLVPTLGLARPDKLTSRKAVFEEIGSSVMITLAMPMLFRRGDDDALFSIDSGWDTTLHFTVDVWEHGSRRHIGTRILVRKIRWDPWKKKYVVRTKGSSGWVARTFAKRADAIAEAVALDRVRVIASRQLTRGGDDGPFYFVTITALRNPIQDTTGAKTTSPRRSGRRDVEWFGRLVDVLAGEHAVAEEVLNIKTNPFFLVPR